MPDFRCYMLDERGHILFPADITAATPDAAVDHAFGILNASNERPTLSAPICAFEVWSGTSRLFPSEVDAPAAAGRGFV